MEWCSADDCDAVAAEVSAVQNISHARAVGQVRFACALWDRLPPVAKVFAARHHRFAGGLDDHCRTENVEDEVIPELDEAIARHVEKWMRLSKTKLRDRVDLWVAKFDPAGVRVPPKVDENRYVEVEAGQSGDGRCFRPYSCHRRGSDGWRLDALAATVCENDPRTHAPASRRCGAGRWGAVRRSLACQCGSGGLPG